MVVVASTIASNFGAVAFAGVSDVFLAGFTALAAGGVLAMLAETMIPEPSISTGDSLAPDRIRIHGRSASSDPQLVEDSRARDPADGLPKN
jgi:hypothetical protein